MTLRIVGTVIAVASLGLGPRLSAQTPAADEALQTALDFWTNINEKNLVENIQGTRERADLVLEKGPDHAIRRIRLRKS